MRFAGRTLAGLTLGVLAAALAGAAPAAAARPDTSGFSAQTSPHFKVHYQEPAIPDPFVAELLDNLEISYARLVAGAGGTPNAGMREPISDAGASSTEVPPEDADGLTDVYIRSLPNNGTVKTDRELPHASYASIDVDPAEPDGAWAIATHELFHVLQNAYVNQMRDAGNRSGLLTESTANWAIAAAGIRLSPAGIFPGITRPLDCTYADWRGVDCGFRYDRWLFFQHLSESYGQTFVAGAWEQLAALCPPRCDDWTGDDGKPHLDAIDREIHGRSGGAATLASRFHRFALDLWNPTGWDTDRVAVLYRDSGPPLARHAQLGSRIGVSATGTRRTTVDHLAANYAVVQPIAGPATPGGPVDVTVTAPAGVPAPRLLVGDWRSGYRSRLVGTVAMTPVSSDGGSRTYRATVDLARHAGATEIVVPMINPTAADGLAFSWSAQLRQSPPPPPPPPATPTEPQLILRTPKGSRPPQRLVARVSCRRAACRGAVGGRAVVKLVRKGSRRRGGRGKATRRVRTIKFRLRRQAFRLDAGETTRVRLRFRGHRRVVRRVTRLLERRRGRVRARVVVVARARNAQGADRGRRVVKLRAAKGKRRGKRNRRAGASAAPGAGYDHAPCRLLRRPCRTSADGGFTSGARSPWTRRRSTRSTGRHSGRFRLLAPARPR